jgi:hypothetical protein
VTIFSTITRPDRKPGVPDLEVKMPNHRRVIADQPDRLAPIYPVPFLNTHSREVAVQGIYNLQGTV